MSLRGPAITITKLLYVRCDALRSMQAASECRLAARLLRAAPHRVALAWRDLRGVGARLLGHVGTRAFRVDGRQIPVQSRTRLSGLPIWRLDVCKVDRRGRGATGRGTRVLRIRLDVRDTSGNRVGLKPGCRRLSLGASARKPARHLPWLLTAAEHAKRSRRRRRASAAFAAERCHSTKGALFVVLARVGLHGGAAPKASRRL